MPRAATHYKKEAIMKEQEESKEQEEITGLHRTWWGLIDEVAEELHDVIEAGLLDQTDIEVSKDKVLDNMHTQLKAFRAYCKQENLKPYILRK